MPIKSDFGAARKAAEKSGELQSGDRFKIEEGPNRIRLLSEFLPHTSYFLPKNAKPGTVATRRFQWLGYILDRKDGQVKTFFMPNVIHGFVESLQADPDWSFDEVPMPYDITINAENAGKMEVKYSLTPSPKRVALTPAEEATYISKKPIEEVQQAIYDKQNEQTTAPTTPDFDPDIILF